MVWAGICATGKAPLIFVEKGVKINSAAYQSMLRDEVLTWTHEHFSNRVWTFMQDGATSHRSKASQDLCKEIFKDLITKEQWPAASPDLNPMDYSIWGFMEEKLKDKRFRSITGLKNALKRVWDEITTEELVKIVDNFPKRLRQCIDVQGGHFEN